MYTYTYCLDGIDHEITSQEPLSAVNGVIPISNQQNVIARELKTLLREWIRLAEIHNVEWFCNGGTLLGAIRDKGLIHYDNDMDLVVFLKDFHKIRGIDCGDKFAIDYCEQGFQFRFKEKKYPFIDLWVEAPNPNNPEQIIIASIILPDGTPTYGANFLWPDDNFDVSDVTDFVKVPFEDMIVNIPKNSEKYLHKMYGDDCLTRYVIYPHTDNHVMYETVPPPELRMWFWNTFQGFEDQPTFACKRTLFIGALIANELATSNKGKTKRHIDIIKRHIAERYLGAPSPFGV